MSEGTESRRLAANLVGRILRDGAYSNVLLRTATRDLSSADRALVYADVYAVVRHLDTVDGLISRLAARETSAIEPDMLDRLRVGVAELKILDMPPHAAVDSVVSTVEGKGRRGFLNAVLRKAASAADLPPSRLPSWLRDSLVSTWGEETVESFEAASFTHAPVGIRLRRGAPEVGEPVEGISGARTLEDARRVGEMLELGQISVADPASTAVGLAVDAQPGQKVLDMASAPGGKTGHLSDAMETTGVLVGADVHFRRLRSAARRLDDPFISWVLMDGTAPAFGSGSFDRVLVDAPCTGLGTLRRRPEIVHRIEPDSIDRLALLQRRMLEKAIELTKPGGQVIYSVCTVTQAETTAVVEGLGSHPPVGAPGIDLGSGVLMGPHIGGTDGMFIAVIDR